MDVISGVSHPRSDSVGLLMMDDSIQYAGHGYCITDPSGQYQPYQKGVNILGRLYGVDLWHDYLVTTYVLSILHSRWYCQMIKYNIALLHVIINNWVHYMITCHHGYYYSLSRGLTVVSFPLMKHVLFYSWTTLRCWTWDGPWGWCGVISKS